jgi:hypothetical protein
MYKKEDLDTYPDSAKIKEYSDSEMYSYRGQLADNTAFLAMIKEKRPDENGNLEANPDYLNPCGGKPDPENPPYVASSLGLFYTLEYLCSDTQGTTAQRMDASIKSASKLQSALNQSLIPMNGQLSDDQTLIGNNQSEDVKERFADAMGSKVFSRYLKRTPSQADRKSQFLANWSWLCDQPSLEESFPEEAQVEKSYSQEPHSADQKRRKEILTPEIREALGCTKDFDSKDCPI